MKEESENRLLIISDLLSLGRSLKEISSDLSKINWDYDGREIYLLRDHLIHVIQKYIDGALLSGDVEKWANLVECRDEIAMDPAHQEIIDRVLHELANPEITQELTYARAAKLLDDLRVR